MANRTFLLQADSMSPPVRIDPPVKALAAGDNFIPVYWFSLFSADCTVANKVEAQGGTIYEYPYLVTSVSDAYQRCSSRRSLLSSVTPAALGHLLDQWLNFIGGIKKPFIHLDVAELWMMDTDAFEPYLNHCLKALESCRVANNGLWHEMLDAAQIDFDDLERTVTPRKLAGYSWGGGTLPWIP